MRYVVENGDIYIIKDNKMVGVNISLTGIKEVGPEKVLPKEYNSYSEHEIIRKFQITMEKPYVFKKVEPEKVESTPKKVGGTSKGKGNRK